jgi:hypothetical protein
VALEKLEKKEDEEIVEPKLEGFEEDEDTLAEEHEEVPDYETLARDKGWVPEDEYNGDKETWVDAKEFLGRAPLYDSIHDLKRTLKRMQAGQDALRKHYDGVHKAAYNKAIKDLQAQMDAAVEENDVKGVVKAQRQMEQVHEEFEQATETIEDDVAAEPTPAFDSWISKNQWYQKDEQLQIYADGVALRLTQKYKDKDPAELFDMVTAEVKKAYPQKFQNPAKKKPAPVEGGSHKGGDGGKSVMNYSKLPEEAKKVYKQLVKSKSNPHGILTSEEFFADYESVDGPYNSEE